MSGFLPNAVRALRCGGGLLAAVQERFGVLQRSMPQEEGVLARSLLRRFIPNVPPPEDP
ncbi:MAG: hypothetical protein H3C29_09395 [Simplicispira suum]|uniref:hypothetical protein n=1 Tax=Simplicispira suum TaxID=2109915 RepID=UPI001C6B5023|nr:hypothetical protein [Simplicispira suum]MBW7833418.1 hypothetical protein [Simplicispira suum]